MRTVPRQTSAFVTSLAVVIGCVTGRTIAAEHVYPGDNWPTASPNDVGLDATQLHKARDYALTGGGSGIITRHGKVALTWGDPNRRYGLKSTTKSIGVTALGLAIKDGHIQLDDLALKHHPTLATPPKSNQSTGWIDKITIQHLATQTAGFEKPGGYNKLVYGPGTKWHYSDAGPNWLAECVTLKYKRDLNDVMFERVFTPIGVTKNDLTWRRNSYRDARIAGVMRREFGSGISANVDAMARIGYLYLRRGKWRDKQIIDASFVDVARRPIKSVVGLPEVDAKNHGNASDHYGLLWWNNADGTLPGVPRDAYWSWGLYDSLIVVIPSLDIVAARAGKSWSRKGWNSHYGAIEPFLNPIAASVKQGDGDQGPTGSKDNTSPYPPSPVFAGIDWAPAESIVRKARGGDNWPITWGDDDALYTAYGDGWGFEPKVERKLSLGLSRVTGGPTEFKGVNLRSKSAELVGDGARGKKASGMLMVDGVLYMFARNARNSQLAWSRDRGRSWQWADWRFTESFGFPTFLNFGRNYAGARDAFVYVYSFDSDSAYKPADRMVLARVSKDRINDRDAYDFYAGTSKDGKPRWSKNVADRAAVLTHEGRCYRLGVTYHAPSKRYLLVHVFDEKGKRFDTRFEGGLAVFDAPQPWGPWTTVFYSKRWDVGPGECASFPTKWMGGDGVTLHLVFSGDDAFSVRQATLRRRPKQP